MTGKLSVEITGARELYIEEGSSLVLSCIVRAAPSPPSLVYWYHGNTLIDYNSPRGGVNLKVRRQSQGEASTSSRSGFVGSGIRTRVFSLASRFAHQSTKLVVPVDQAEGNRKEESVDRQKGVTRASMSVFSVGPGDSGMYSCVPPGSHPATVHVHVQKGEHEAAIQQGGLSESLSSTAPPAPALVSSHSSTRHSNHSLVVAVVMLFSLSAHLSLLQPTRWRP
ncbi:Immunoglobulin-like domain [Trinorchestia longiramus]|nr:Immunoglobulin-like domain [Trinorchestia longiramus]